MLKLMTLRVEECSLSELEETPQEYQEVLGSSGEDGIFLGLDWLSAWWHAFGEGKRPLVLRVVEDGRAEGFAPLMTTSRGRARWTKVEFMGTGPSDRCGILARDGRTDVQAAVWEHLRERDDWDVMELRDMCQDGPTARAVRSAFPHAEEAGEPAPFVRLDGTHEAYLAGLSKNMRSNLGRGWRRLQEEGAEFRALRTPDEVSEAVDWLNELNDQRWESSSTLRAPGMPGFVRDVSLRLAGRGVVYHALLVKGEPFAITMGLEDRRRYLYYLSGFGPERAKHSPGGVLLSKIIEESFHLGKEEVDLLRGAEAYKYRFNARDRHQVHLRAVNRGLLRRGQYQLREAPLA